jgi:hypothetical protein
VRNKKTRARRMCIGDLLGLAEGLGKCGFSLDPHASNIVGEERCRSRGLKIGDLRHKK